MNTREMRLLRLVEELRAAGGWVTGKALADRLDVTTRSIRDYVQAVNSGTDNPLVVSGPGGYRLNVDEHRRQRARAKQRTRNYDTPEQRLYFIIRELAAHPEGVDVFVLADELYVSSATIEADLRKARELLREHQLTTVRSRDNVSLQGAERQIRRLLRQLLLGPGALPPRDRLLATADPAQQSQLRELHAVATKALAAAGLVMNEYALNDVLIHLLVATARVTRAPQPEAAPPPQGGRLPTRCPAAIATDLIVEGVQQILGVRLPDTEVDLLRAILQTRGGGAERPTVGSSAQVHEITRAAIQEVSRQYLLDLDDEATVEGLSQHVQNLIARCQLGRALDTPLGLSLRNLHPLVHELALLFAREVEQRAGVRVPAGEVDFLAFHLGNQVQQQMAQDPIITITCVVPSYGDFHHQVPERISAALQGHAVVNEVVTSLSHNWDDLKSDLVVTVIDIDEVAPVPTVRVSPFLTKADLDRVSSAVNAERSRLARLDLRAKMVSLLDPSLFIHAVTEASRSSVLASLATVMQAQGYVNPGFLDEVLEREERSSTAFGGEFAIPHSLQMNSRKTGIAVLVSDTPIQWGTSRVRLGNR